MILGIINYPDGKYYEGETRNEIPLRHGKGKIYKEDGKVFIDAF